MKTEESTIFQDKNEGMMITLGDKFGLKFLSDFMQKTHDKINQNNGREFDEELFLVLWVVWP